MSAAEVEVPPLPPGLVEEGGEQDVLAAATGSASMPTSPSRLRAVVATRSREQVGVGRQLGGRRLERGQHRTGRPASLPGV